MTKQTHQEWLDGENEPETTKDQIKLIIKTGSHRNRYTKDRWLKLDGDELSRLNDLIDELN